MTGCCELHSLFIFSHVAPTCTSADDEGSVASAIAHPTTAPTRPPPVSTISTSRSSSSLTRTDARRGGSVTSSSGSTRPVIGFRSSNQKVAPATRKRKNEQDDHDTLMENMMAFMLEDRKLEIENRKHEIVAAQMEIRRIEEQARKEDRIAAEQVRSEDMEMRRQEFRMMSMLVMQMASTSNNNGNNRLFETDRSSELVTQHSLVSHHLCRLAITLFFGLF